MNKSSLKLRITIFLSIFIIWGILRFFLMMKIRSLCFHLFTIDDPSIKTLLNHCLISIEASFLYLIYFIYTKLGWLESIKIKTRNHYIFGILVGMAIFISAFSIAFHYEMQIYPEFSFINFIGNIFSNAGEEYIYRGLLYVSALTLFRSTTIAIILSSIAFGAGHWDLPILFQAYISIVGIMLGLVYHKVQNLTIPYISHTIADLLTDSFFH